MLVLFLVSFLFFVFFFFGGTGVFAQGLTLDRQALLPLEPLCQPYF
jgi:hypothetical protein